VFPVGVMGLVGGAVHLPSELADPPAQGRLLRLILLVLMGEDYDLLIQGADLDRLRGDDRPSSNQFGA
jgi:hypothetical protein